MCTVQHRINPMLANLVQSIEWRLSPTSNTGKTAVVLDASFAEAFKWNLDEAHVPTGFVILSLGVDDETAYQLSSNDISRFIVFTSKLSMSLSLSILHMLRSTSAMECCILSSVSSEAAESITFSSSLKRGNTLPNETGYQGLQEMLLPVKARVSYFPLHTIHIMDSEHNNQVRFHLVLKLCESTRSISSLYFLLLFSVSRRIK